MADRERVIEHLQIVRTWASVGKEPIYNGIEPRCCENVEKWMDDALALLREQDTVDHALDVLKKHGWKDDSEVTGDA